MSIVTNLVALPGLVWVVIGLAGLAQAVTPPVELAHEPCGNMPFALELYAQLKAADGNLCVSPASLASALSMTLAGARGRTEAQISEVLYPECSPHGLDHAIPEPGDDGQLLLANALWGRVGVDLRDEFLTTIHERYAADYRQLDFNNDTGRAHETINRWIADRTGRRIAELLAEADLDPDTVLVLTSAIHFAGRWAFSFDETRTSTGEFELREGRRVQVALMEQTATFPFASFGEVDLLELPYESSRWAMVLLVPAAGHDVSDLGASLTTDNLSRWLDGLSQTPVEVRMPRFEVDTRLELTETLRALGMVDAFTERADFSGMSAARPLFISKVVHRTVVEVDEHGSEGASAGGVVLKKGPRPRVITVDRPFMFLVRDRRTGNILFLGRVMDPRA
jgi:serpin B